MPISTSSHFGGSEAVAKVLAGLSNEMKTRMLVPALSKVGTVLQSAMKANVRVNSGALRDDIHTKTVGYPTKGTAVAITGARRKVRYNTRRGSVMPSKYANLEENGHIAKNGKFVPGSKFMSRAVESVSPVAGEIIAGDLMRQIENTAKKFGAK